MHKSKKAIFNDIFVSFSVKIIATKIKPIICSIYKYYKVKVWTTLIIHAELTIVGPPNQWSSYYGLIYLLIYIVKELEHKTSVGRQTNSDLHHDIR